MDFESAKFVMEIKDFQLLTDKRKSMPSLVQSVMPFARNLAYPINKVANESNINTIREAKANLDKFWNIIDQHFGDGGRDLHKLLLRHGAKAREIKRTPPYTESHDGDSDHRVANHGMSD